MDQSLRHTPVLLQEVLKILDPKSGEHVLDCTVGLGGHAAAFLEKIGSRGTLVGVDADETNLNVARENLKGYKNVELVQGNFGSFFRPPLPNPPPKGEGINGFDIIFADLGLSSPHVDDPNRGFTYRLDAPLDLRFDQSQGETAAQLLERISEKELADNLFQLGELRESRRLAREIKKNSMVTTWDLKKAVEDVIGWRAKKILPRVFQALRIKVNDELDALAILLHGGPSILRPGGRIGVISYHSLEDRMVKHAFKELCFASQTFELLTKKPITPSEQEIKENPRSRSGKLRVIRNILS